MQPDANSVQEELSKALSKILQEEIQVVGAGRTDTGVHASEMFAHFDSHKPLEDAYVYRFNSVLPNDIVIHSLISVVDDAHARFDAISRSYEYHIWQGRNPFLLETSWQLYQQHLDIPLMNEAAKILLEYTDFECFSKVKTDVKTFHCTVSHAEWKSDGKKLVFHITANRFLRNMVRAIVGTLIEVGQGKKSIADFRDVIESKQRSKAGLSVPAQGLFLTEVKYEFSKLVTQNS
jgi:tRNA pseudouridine38-40 synthase